MGAWGYKIFQDDTALDVKDSYHEKLAVGLSDEQAEAEIITEFKEGLEDIWLPLAVTEWEFGRLNDTVKFNALATIKYELNSLSEIWKEDLVAKRRKELEDTRTKLCSEMPERKKIRKPSWALKSPFVPGNVVQFKIAYTNVSTQQWLNKYTLLEVVGIKQRPPNKIPLETISVRPYKWYSEKPISDIGDICDHFIETISFYFGEERFVPTMTFMPMIQDVKTYEMKCISKVPLGGREVQDLGVGNPSNAVISQRLAQTLDYYFSS